MKSARVLKYISKIASILTALMFICAPSFVYAFGPADLGLSDAEQADAEAFCAAAGPADCASAEQACNADPVKCKADIQSAREQCASYGALCDAAKSYCQDPANAETCKNALTSNDPAGTMLGILTGGGGSGGSSGGGGGNGPLGVGFGTIAGGVGGTDVNAPAAPKGPPPETISVFGQIAAKIPCIREGKCTNLDDLLGAFAIVAQWILGITGSVVLLMFVWGGAEWVYSAGNSKTVQSGKDKMKYAVMGLTLVFASLAIVRTISAGLGVTAIQCISDQECKADAPYCLAGKCSKTKDNPIQKTTTPSTQPTSSQPLNARGDECTIDDNCISSGKGYVCFPGQSKNVCVSACLYVKDETKCLASKEDNVSCMWDGPSHQCFKPAAYLGTDGAPCVGNSQSGTCGSGMTCVYSRPSVNTGTGLPTYVCTTGEAGHPCNDVAFAPEPNGGCKTGLTCVSKRCEVVETCHTTADCSTVGYSCVGGGVIFSGTCKKDCSGISGAVCKHSPAYNICPNGGQWVTSAACPNDGDICCL